MAEPRIVKTGKSRSTIPYERILVEVPTERLERCLQKRTLWSKVAFSAGAWAAGGPFSQSLVVAGNWHRRTVPFAEHPAYRLLKAFLGEDYREDACLAALAGYYQDRGRSRRQAERKASAMLKRYLHRYRTLAESMAREGYVVGRGKDEIGIAIAPGGSLIKVANGNHRLAAAMLMGVPHVVAEVRFVHRDWYAAVRPEWRPAVPEAIGDALRKEGYRLIQR